jgi:hypothetical protein
MSSLLLKYVLISYLRYCDYKIRYYLISVKNAKTLCETAVFYVLLPLLRYVCY